MATHFDMQWLPNALREVISDYNHFENHIDFEFKIQKSFQYVLDNPS